MGGRQGSRRVALLCAPVLLVAVLLGVALAASLTACGGSAGGDTNAPGPTPKQGGTYNYPLTMDPGKLDPANVASIDSYAVVHQLFEGLARYELQSDGTLKTAPCLAESWSGNADATVWTIKLRRGVMFQEPVSREVTAADVVADLRYMADPANGSYIAYMLGPIKGVDPTTGYASPEQLGVQVLDRYTVRFTLKYPYSEFPDTLGQPAYYVWPVDYLRKVGLKAFARHPVGTGPYQFLRRLPGTSIDLVRNPHWWDTSGGPYIDTLHYEVFGNVTAMTLAFQKGLVDWTTVPQGQVAASRSLPQVKSGQWKAESTPTLGLGYLCVNMRDPLVGGTQGLALRQALTYGCDRQAASDAASGGLYQLPTGLVPPGVPGSQDVKEPYPYDPAKAKELIKRIGPVTLELDVAREGGRLAQLTAQSLTASYAKLGITLKPRNASVERLASGKSQLFPGGWLADYPSMDDFLYPLFESGSSATLFTFYSNRKVDALLAKARATPDQEARVGLYADAERQILADAPVVPLFVFADGRLLNSRVANVRFNSMSWADLWRAWVK